MKSEIKKLLQKTLVFGKKSLTKLSSLKQLESFFNVLNKKEKRIFYSLVILLIASFLFLLFFGYFKNTELKPKVNGKLTEAMLGQPRFINPVLATSDIDRDLTEILFSGLMKYDDQGNIIPDLAESYEILDQGRIYDLVLKNNIVWHDKEPLTADDVVFTIKTIQNPESQSPEIVNWIGVEIEKISDYRIRFSLKDPYFPFLERLTLKILPEHIFKQITPGNIALTGYNLEPIGSGPFEIKKIKKNRTGKIESITLTRNSNYHTPVYLQEIKFLFFETKQELFKSIKRGESKAISISDFQDFKILKSGLNTHTSSSPRYFALFFNSDQNPLLKNDWFKQALTLGTNKEEILEKAVYNQGKVINSPILPQIYGFDVPEQSEFNPEKAQQILQENGYQLIENKLIDEKTQANFNFTKDLKSGSKNSEVESLQQCLSNFPDIYPEAEVSGYFGAKTKQAVIKFQEKYRQDILDPWDFEKGTGMVSKTTRQKLNQICNEIKLELNPVELTITTINQEFLIRTAELLKQQWEKLGFKVNIQSLDFNELSQEYIKPREYEILLFGEILNLIPDPFPFWHSSRINDPGLNLAIYENKKADNALERARMAETYENLKTNLQEFQEILISDNPSIFLYNPNFIYLIDKNIKGIDFEILSDPAKRFNNINNWYTDTKRVWKQQEL